MRASSTDRIAGFGQPVAVISSSSSNEIWSMRRASATTRGSVVNTPGTSVYSSQASASSAWARATAVVSDPPRPKKVTSLSVDTPWLPPTTGTRPDSTVARIRSGRTRRILALRWVVSVRNPAWLPVKESDSIPRSWRAIDINAQALRSPPVMSMSISRPGLEVDT